MAADARVAVLVVTRDRRELLLRGLARHLALPERPRVVVVDDGSTDGTAAAAAALGARITIVRMPRSIGGAARNAGLRVADAPYVALCDDDSWFRPGALRQAADLLDAHPRLGVVNGHVLVGPEERTDPLCHEMARSPLPRIDGQPGHALLSFLAGASVVRRRAVLEAGGFSERLGIGGEEELLAWDLAAAGWLASYVPEVVAHHHPPPHRGRPERREQGIRNMLWTTWLRLPPRAAAARSLALLRSAPRDRHTARAIARALAGLPWLVRERRTTPPHVQDMRALLAEQQRRSRARRYVG